MADLQRKSREVGKIHVKVDVDVSDALTGLKAVQREAKKATRSLAELKAEQERDARETINDLRDLQGYDGNWNYSPYMRGLFNGLELASATLEGRDAEYKDVPTTYIELDGKEVGKVAEQTVSDDIRRSYE